MTKAPTWSRKIWENKVDNWIMADTCNIQLFLKQMGRCARQDGEIKIRDIIQQLKVN